MNDVITAYPLEQAVADGIVTTVHGLKEVDNKPLVVTAHLIANSSPEELQNVWDAFLQWRRDVMPTLPKEERMFVTEIQGKKIWVDETPDQVTLMYPEEY